MASSRPVNKNTSSSAVTRAEKAQISGKQCTVQLSGKNATNLKTHLSRFHKEEFQLVETQDAEKEEASSNVSSCKRVTLDTQPEQEQATLMSCFSRTETNRVYAENSAEYNRCLHGSIADYDNRHWLPAEFRWPTAFHAVLQKSG
jgi:hypothetical protein